MSLAMPIFKIFSTLIFVSFLFFLQNDIPSKLRNLRKFSRICRKYCRWTWSFVCENPKFYENRENS